jgi:hypothetical protein
VNNPKLILDQMSNAQVAIALNDRMGCRQGVRVGGWRLILLMRLPCDILGTILTIVPKYSTVSG